MAKQTTLQGTGLPGRLRSYTAKAESIAPLAHLPLKTLTMGFGGDLGFTLGLQGNTLPISTVTTVPDAAPPGGKGVVFHINGSTLTIYAWDGSAWRSN